MFIPLMFGGRRRRRSVGRRDRTLMEAKMQKAQRADVGAQKVATRWWLAAGSLQKSASPVRDHAENLNPSLHAQSRPCFRNVKVVRQD